MIIRDKLLGLLDISAQNTVYALEVKPDSMDEKAFLRGYHECHQAMRKFFEKASDADLRPIIDFELISKELEKKWLEKK